MAQIALSFRDVIQGRARLRIPWAGKLLLMHWMGAPWVARDPEAFLHGMQAEALARREREQIVHGGSGLGKSILGGCKIALATMLPDRKVGVVAARYDHVAHEFEYAYNGLRTLFRGRSSVFPRFMYRNAGNNRVYEIDTVWGTRTRGFSTEADDGASLLGQEFTDVIVGEGSNISLDILEKRILRALDRSLMNRPPTAEIGTLTSYTTAKAYEGFTAHEFTRVKKAGKGDVTVFNLGRTDWVNTVWIREADVLENPAYSRATYAARRRNLSKAAFEEQYGGKMTFKSGAIYPSFTDSHVVPMPNADLIRSMRLFVGIDTGAYFAAALLGLTPQGVCYVLGEVYTEKLKIGDSCEEVRDMIVDVLGGVFDDPYYANLHGRVDRWIVDPASQHKMELIDELDIGTISLPTRANGEFNLGPTIDTIKDLFDTRRLLIVDTCTATIDQFTRYIWKSTRMAGTKGEVIREPKKVDDHLCDAVRFAAVPLTEEGPLEVMPEATTWAEQWQRDQREMVFGPLKSAMNGNKGRGPWVGLG